MTKVSRQRDAAYLAQLLLVHAGIDASDPNTGDEVHDGSWCKGAIWGRLPIRKSIFKSDINPDLPGLDLASSWADLPRHVARASRRVFVVDPIHVGDVGRTSKRYSRYVAPQYPVKGPSIAPLFPDIFDAGEWLLKPRVGVMLVKIIDLVHNGRFQHETRRLAAYAESRGWTVCQYAAMPKAPGRDAKHKNRLHVDIGCTYWFVLRYGPACHGPGVQLTHELVCEECGEKFTARRSDARFCPGGKCRKRRQRRSNA